ncbi:MAG: AtpZ/AtpI family protein [Candidatus Brocadiaceae bacterium]|nr:AtpZ/AtpI family protein [Candidatus Brocadiaceae bacterium]
MVDPQERQHQDTMKKFTEEIGKKEIRKLKGRREKNRNVIWLGMGTSGIIGWSVTIPTLTGITLGIYMDKRWPSSFSWTIMLLGIGIVLGCLNAWFWIKTMSKND